MWLVVGQASYICIDVSTAVLFQDTFIQVMVHGRGPYGSH